MNELYIKLGSLLKTERERQNIKLEDLSERLKISAPYLQSIESGTTDGLPSELYFSLFAKSYAESLGIDYARTVEAIKFDVEESEKKPEKTKNGDKKQSESNTDQPETENQFLKKAGIALAVIVGVFVIFLGVNKFFFASKTAETGTEQISETENKDQQETSKEFQEAYTNYDWEDKEYVKPEKFILTLTPQKESWSAIFADGDTAIYRTLRVGRTYKAEADYRMIVSIGVPSAVTVKLNGQEVDLRNKESRRIYKVLINQMNIDNFLNRNDESQTKATQNNQPVTTAIDSVLNDNSKTN